MSEPTAVAVSEHSTETFAVTRRLDPFELMDRADEGTILAELEGIEAREFVYIVTGPDGKEVVGLSKVGVDECSTRMGRVGEALREEKLEYEVIGDGENAEALFRCTAARYMIGKDGREAKLDQVIGLKRQPLYREAAVPLTLDSKCPGKKPNGRTFRQMLDSQDGRGYLNWMKENFRDEAIKEFVTRILNGEDPQIQPGRQLNPHWFEQGGMKAARNAKFRLIPSPIRAEVIAIAQKDGKTKRLEQEQYNPADGKRVDAKKAETVTPLTPMTGSIWGKYEGKGLSEMPTGILQKAVFRNLGPQNAEIQAVIAMILDARDDEPPAPGGE